MFLFHNSLLLSLVVMDTVLFRWVMSNDIIMLDFVLHFPFLVIVFPLRNSGPCDSFDYLGHSKNVVVDDDDDGH